MIPERIIQGTGEEIAKYAQEHPRDHFQLIVLSQDEPKQHGPGSEGWEKMMRVIHSFKGKLPTLPPDATTTESLYEY